MPRDPFVRPDQLVLAAGGILGEAWMNGVLAGIEEAAGADFRAVEAMVGTSAGSIVAAHLAAGKRPRRPSQASRAADPAAPREHRRATETDANTPTARALAAALARWASLATAPLAPVVLAVGAPGGAALRAAMLARSPSRGLSLSDLHRRIAALSVRFDGRLRIVCVERSRGRRVIFGAPGAPPASVADAVVASCSIPWVFHPVEIGGTAYVDGGVWSVTNLDAAPIKRGTRILCLNPTASFVGRIPGPLAALRGAMRATATLETHALRRRGAEVETVIPDADSSALMGINLMDPQLADPVLERGFRQGLALGSTPGA